MTGKHNNSSIVAATKGICLNKSSMCSGVMTPPAVLARLVPEVSPEESVSKLQGGGRVSLGEQLSLKIQPLTCYFISPKMIAVFADVTSNASSHARPEMGSLKTETASSFVSSARTCLLSPELQESPSS